MSSQATRKSFFKKIFGASRRGIVVIDESGIIKRTNLVATKIFGYRTDELISQDIRILIPQSNYKKHKSLLRLFLKHSEDDSKEVEVEFCGLKKDNSPVSIVVNAHRYGKPENHETGLIITKSNYKVKTALKDSNKKFKTLINNLQGIVYRCSNDENMTMKYVSNACLNITGYDSQEFYSGSIHFGNIIHKDDIEYVRMEIQNAFRQNEHFNLNFRIRSKNGMLKHINQEGSPVFNKEGEVVAIAGYIFDLTRQKKEQFLKDATKEILKMIIREEPLSVIENKIKNALEEQITDSIASITLLENKACNQYYFPHSDVTNSAQDPLIIDSNEVHTDSVNNKSNIKYKVSFTDIPTNRLQNNNEIEVAENSAKAFWSFPILSPKEKVLGSILIHSKERRRPLESELGIIKDIIQLARIALEQHHSKSKLLLSNLKLEKNNQQLEAKIKDRTKEVMITVQKLVEANLNLEDQIKETKAAENTILSSKAMSSAIAQNFPKGVILVVNKEYKIIFAEGKEFASIGLEDLYFEGMSIDDISIFSNTRKTKLKQEVNLTIAKKQLSFETKFDDKYFAVNTTPLFDEYNNVTSALFVFTNITEHKRIELNIQNSLKIEQDLNKLKSQFISIASHEFRTPLSIIMSSAILIEKQFQPGKEEKTEKFIAKIKSNVYNLVMILDDLLSLSKLEEGEIVASPIKLDLIVFVNSIIEEIESIKKKGQRIKIIQDLPFIQVYLDPKLLSHILTNLVSNAIKFSPEDSEITVKLNQKRATIRIEIIDKGIGIPEQEQTKLFQRFFRASNANNIQGTGLGLNITKKYVDLLGGTIDFISKEAEGTTFIIELPKILK